VKPAHALELDAYRVRPPFSHPEHKKRSRDDQCMKCHVNVAVGAGVPPPLPPMPACEKCHDGDGAFRALGTTCGRCHVRSDAMSTAMSMASTKTSTAVVSVPLFEHSRHAQKAGLSIKECTGCHADTKPNGRLKFPGQVHKPCSNDTCHAAEFRKRTTQYCIVCHAKNEPFGKNPLKQKLGSGRIEFETPFSHKSHLAKKALAATTAGGPCARCHAAEMGLERPKPPPGVLAPGHELCANCHEAVASPKILECAGCHRLGGQAQSTAGAAKTQGDDFTWRVKANFSHLTHRFDTRKGKETTDPLACTECHGDVERAEPGAAVPRPTMAGCGRTCHNGQVAFKTTGFLCTKCHGEVQAATVKR
jgi:hypothetical protein